MFEQNLCFDDAERYLGPMLATAGGSTMATASVVWGFSSHTVVEPYHVNFPNILRVKVSVGLKL